MKRPICIDLSRLFSRIGYPTPTGIDRVEHAYARYFLGVADREVHFEFRWPGLGWRELSRETVRSTINAIQSHWETGTRTTSTSAQMRLLSVSSRPKRPSRAITIFPTHQPLHARPTLQSRRQNGGSLLIFLHDTIPADFPEYAKKGGAERHVQRINNVLDLADGVIVNSNDTAAQLARRAKNGNVRFPILVNHIGTEPLATIGRTKPSARPHFVVLGTIEPRKNHLLLLHVWRQLAQMDLPAQPVLQVIGRRGWENENIVDLLDRGRFASGGVVERAELGDAELRTILSGARALLMPSFAEGYGMPLAEALGAGVPVIASDLPVFREIGGKAPVFLDPLDGPSWRNAILDFSKPDSPLRAACLKRLVRWKAPTWDGHFLALERFLDGFE